MGHPGHHHPFSSEPDEVIDLQLPACPHCGSEDLEMSEGEARQIVDIPEIKPTTREYRQKIGCCKNCGKKSLFRDLLNLTLSRGTVDNTLRRLHKKFQPEIKHITGECPITR